VNIELYTPVPTTDGTDTILIGVDKLADAKRVLSNQLTEWSVPERIPAGMSSRL
jgi:hypothetical protein